MWTHPSEHQQLAVNNESTVSLPFYLGCPVWNCAEWGGEVYPVGSKRSDYLHWYSRTFNTVEGNSTFYGLPTRETATRWAEQAAVGFRFALKFPRLISHELRLIDTNEELRRFCEVLSVLASGEVLGPAFLQLPPDYGPENFEHLRAFLKALPHEFPWAVEVRHHGWFDGGHREQQLDELLEELRIDKVLFDSRPLYSLPPEDESERVSQARKPKTPHRETVTAKHPMVRIVGRNRPEQVVQAIDDWAEIIVGWLQTGLKPYVFTHSPDDKFAPTLARLLADKIRTRMPGLNPIPQPPQPLQQKMLFE